MKSDRGSKWHVISLLLLLCLAFGLRIWGLNDHNIWWDEGVGAWLARLPTTRILHWTGHDVHPPLHYLVVRAWWLLVGDGPFLLRFPSALAGVLSVAAIYRLAKALGRREAGLLTALFLTVSRFAIMWSQELRMYTLATLLTTIALWAAIRIWQGGTWPSWLGYILASAGSLYTLYLTAPVLVITNLAFLVAWLRSGRPGRLLFHWVAAQLAVLALLAPWLAYALPRMHAWSSDAAFSPGFFVQLYATMLAVGVSLDIGAYLLPTVAVFLIAAAGVVALLRRRQTPAQTAGATMLLSGLLLPPLIVYVVSSPLFGFYYSRPLAPRYLLPLAPCFYALSGWGLAALGRRHRWAARAGSLVVVAVALSGLVSFYPGRVRRDDLTSLSATLRAHRRLEDAAFLYTDVDWPIFAAAYAGDWRGVPYGMDIDPAAANALLQPVWETSEGVWLVTTPDALRADPEQIVRQWLAERSVSSTSWDYGDHILTLFARTPDRAAASREVGPDFAPPRRPRADVAPGGRLVGASIPLPRYLSGDTVHLALVWDPPPSQPVAIGVSGPGEDRRVVAAPQPAPDGPTRQQVDVPLPPGLAAGRYHVWLEPAAGGERLTLGDLTLIARDIEGTAPDADIDTPLAYTFGESIQLLGYDMPQTTGQPGDVVELTLYWQATEPVDARYKVFVHFLGETYNAATDNFIWGQQDNEPVSGQSPTTAWIPGAVIADPYRVTLPPDTPPGRYAIEIGIYGLVDGVRLPIFDAEGTPQGDALILTHVEVVE